MSLDRLFSPLSIGSLKLENRIVMPPMATNFASLEGYVTDKQIDYYVERAKSGVGYNPFSSMKGGEEKIGGWCKYLVFIQGVNRVMARSDTILTH